MSLFSFILHFLKILGCKHLREETDFFFFFCFKKQLTLVVVNPSFHCVFLIKNVKNDRKTMHFLHKLVFCQEKKI